VKSRREEDYQKRKEEQKHGGGRRDCREKACKIILLGEGGQLSYVNCDRRKAPIKGVNLVKSPPQKRKRLSREKPRF